MRKALLFAGVSLLSMQTLRAQDLIHEGIAYNYLSGEELEVTALPDNQGYSGNVHIPHEIVMGEEGPVCSSGRGMTGGEDDIVAYRVVRVGDRAFRNCTGLTGLELPYSLEEIGSEAIAGCTSLTEVTMPRNLRRIGDRAFEGSSFRSLTVTEGLEEIGDRVFYHTTAGDIILEGCALKAFGSETFTGSTVERILLPEGLRSIPEDTFKGCASLVYVGFNCSLEEICSGAFSGCSSLRALTLPGSLREIGEGAFSGVVVKSVCLNSVGAPAYPIESVCGDTLPGLVAFPGASEQQYREWCPGLFEGKATVRIGGEFGSGLPKWVYPGTVDPGQLVSQIPHGVSVDDTMGETLVLAEEGGSVSVCCPVLVGAGYDFEINGEKTPYGTIFSDLDSFYRQYWPTAYIGDSSFVTLENVEGNYTVNVVDDNAVGIEGAGTDIPDDSGVTVYDMNGVPVGDSTEGLPSGIYIRKQGGHTEKTIVR